LIAFETFHYIRKPRKKNNGHVGIKLDIAKTYDSLEWDFIELTFKVMGFPNNMIFTIMQCIRTVTFSILINGHLSDTFSPNRGLGQGDPLSPYLYIICVEVLSGMIDKAQKDGQIKGIAIATNAPAISHLLYADDSILFCRAKLEEGKAIMDILQNYQAMGKKSTLTSLRWFLVQTYHKTTRSFFKNFFLLKLVSTSQNTLECLLNLGDLMRRILTLSWIESGRNLKDGRKNVCPLKVRGSYQSSGPGHSYLLHELFPIAQRFVQ